MNQLTPAQIKVIETWTEKRDILLREIGVYQTQLNDHKKELTGAGLNLADLHKSIAEARGRLAELDALEERHKNSISVELAELEIRKTRLETECTDMEKRIKASETEQSRIVTSITVLCEAHDKMADQAKIVNDVVSQIIQTSQSHTSDMRDIMAEIRTIAAEVIEKGNENVKQTGIVLEKLPKYIFELQRPIPVRRTYAAPRGTVIDPENKKPTE